MPRVPSWIKLAAASKDELLSEVMLAIDELGGVEEAQKALRELASDKKSNWVLTERFITAAKPFGKELELLHQDALDRKPMKPAPAPEAPKPEEKSPEAPVEEKKDAPVPAEPQKTTPEKLEGRGAYLAALLAMLLGVGGTLTVDYLRKINLERTLEEIKQQVPRGRAQELANEPLPPPGIELKTPEEVASWKKDTEKRISEWHKEIARVKDPKMKQDEEAELRKFEFSYKVQLKQIEEALAEPEE